MRPITLTVIGLSLIFFVTCDFPQPPQIITVSSPSPMKPSKPSDIQTPGEAIAVIMTVGRKNLGLPVVNPIQLLLYKNNASFASYGQGWRTLPIDVDDLTAFTQGNKIHINLAKTGGKKWGALISLLAHEYTHAIEAAVAKRYTSSWFGEGFASWIAAKTVHALGWQDYSVTFERAKFELINSQPLPTFNDMAWNWKALRHASNGFIKTYVLAFVAVDRLVTKGGFSATMQ